MSWVRRLSWQLLAASVAGFATAFFRLGVKGLWGDEVWESWWATQQDLLHTFLRFRSPPDLPLHFLLVQLSTAANNNPFWIRLPSALLGAATVIVLFSIGSRIFGPPTGLVAALLLAAAPFHVWYSQDARPYAGLAFYSLLTLYFFYLLVEHPSAPAAVGFTISTILNIYNHLFALFPLTIELSTAVIWTTAILSWPAIGGHLQEWHQRPRHLPNFATPGSPCRHVLRFLLLITIAAVLAIAASYPLFGGITGYLRGGGAGEVAAPPFQVTPEFLHLLLSLFGAGPGWSVWLLLILFGVGVSAGIWQRCWFVLLALGWLGLPFFVLWVAQPRHIFVPRYFLFIQPVYMLIVAYGLIQTVSIMTATINQFVDGRLATGRRLRSFLPGVGTALLTLITFVPTWQGYWVEKVNNWSGICRYLHLHYHPGDIVTGNGYTQGIFLWCFDSVAPVSVVAPGGYPAPTLTRTGRNVWYARIGADASTAEDAFIRHTYTRIARSNWDLPRLRLPATTEDKDLYPQAENPVSLYYHRASPHVSHIQFLDVHSLGSRPIPPGYLQVNPGQWLELHLGFLHAGTRALRITYLDLAGRNLDVSIDGVPPTQIRPMSHIASFESAVIPVPGDAQVEVVVDLKATGTQADAISEVDVLDS